MKLAEYLRFTQAHKLEQLFTMNKIVISTLTCVAALFAAAPNIAAAKAAAPEAAKPAVSAPAPALAERSQNPQMDATAFGLGTGTYGNYGFLGGHLQIGVLDWLRLSGAITGSLPGDQPSGNFAMSNYWLLWHFSGGLVFTSTKLYKNIARPYSMLELTYFYDAKFKAGGVNGSFRIGVDFYMTQDYSIYIEAGVNAPFMRDMNAPALVGGVVGIGARAFF